MTSRLDHLPDDRRQEIARDLGAMLALDEAAIKGYDAALRRLDDEALHHQVAAFHEEHERHARDLETMLDRLGAEGRDRTEATSGFKEAVTGAGEDDRAILTALREQEEHIRLEYDKYASKDYPTVIDRLLKDHAQDEHHHHDWAANKLRQTGE